MNMRKRHDRKQETTSKGYFGEIKTLKLTLAMIHNI